MRRICWATSCCCTNLHNCSCRCKLSSGPRWKRSNWEQVIDLQKSRKNSEMKFLGGHESHESHEARATPARAAAGAALAWALSCDTRPATEPVSGTCVVFWGRKTVSCLGGSLKALRPLEGGIRWLDQDEMLELEVVCACQWVTKKLRGIAEANGSGQHQTKTCRLSSRIMQTMQTAWVMRTSRTHLHLALITWTLDGASEMRGMWPSCKDLPEEMEEEPEDRVSVFLDTS